VVNGDVTERVVPLISEAEDRSSRCGLSLRDRRARVVEVVQVNGRHEAVARVNREVLLPAAHVVRVVKTTQQDRLLCGPGLADSSHHGLHTLSDEFVTGITIEGRAAPRLPTLPIDGLRFVEEVEQHRTVVLEHRRD